MEGRRNAPSATSFILINAVICYGMFLPGLIKSYLKIIALPSKTTHQLGKIRPPASNTKDKHGTEKKRGGEYSQPEVGKQKEGCTVFTCSLA